MKFPVSTRAHPSCTPIMFAVVAVTPLDSKVYPTGQKFPCDINKSHLAKAKFVKTPAATQCSSDVQSDRHVDKLTELPLIVHKVAENPLTAHRPAVPINV